MNKPKIYTAAFLATATLLLVFLIFTNNYFKKEKWPEIDLKPEYEQVVNSALKEYKLNNVDYKRSLQSYDPFADYLNWGIVKSFSESEQLKLDDNNIPTLKYGDEFYYNPGTVAQYALTMYGQYLHGSEGPTKFLDAADRLIELQDQDGSFRYQFPWHYYLLEKAYEPGWFSGMDSGQVLSVFARAYHLTKDEKYLEHGNKALVFLITPKDKGGPMDTLEHLDPSLKEYIIFEEYLAEPAGYTLNGFMFSVIGLYDWSQVDSKTQEEAKEYYQKGIETLEKILPYYDIGGFSAYDLGHITFDKLPHYGIHYHAIHIQFCNIFYQLTGDEIFMEYYKKWSSYVDEDTNVESNNYKSPLTLYSSLLDKFPIDRQGFGLDTYVKGNSEQSETYGLVLSAESIRYKSKPTIEGRQRIRNAVKWLLNNRDLDGDGIAGWGLPEKWDAFGDGSTNPTNQSYTITNALILEGLLDSLILKDFWENEEINEIQSTIKEILLSYSEYAWTNTQNGGFYWYSTNKNDAYFTFNVSSALMGVAVRFINERPDALTEEQKEFLKVKVNKATKSIVENVHLDNEGLPFWTYVAIPNPINHERPNDLVHHVYILWGIEKYRQYYDDVEIPWTLEDAVDSTKEYWKNDKLHDYPQNIVYSGDLELFNYRPSNLWGNGMAMAFLAKYGMDDESEKILEFTIKEYGEWPNLQVWPSWYSENNRFFTRYAAHMLWGLMYYINNDEF